MNFIVDRLKEPSTFAGLSGVALALGVSAPVYNAVSTIVAGVFGLIAVLKKDRLV